MKRELDSNLRLHEDLLALARAAKKHLEENPHPHDHVLPAEYIHPWHYKDGSGK